MMLARRFGDLLLKEKCLLTNLGKSMSTTPLVDIKVNEKNGIATVTMQKAPVNSLNLELLKELGDTIDKLSADRSRGMILTSAMPTIFTGGLDIMEMYKPDPNRVKEFWTSVQDFWYKLYGSSFPTAAAINGHSPAGGCLTAMSCEYRAMVGGKYTIGLNETALGIVAPKFFQNTMLNTISPRVAEMSLTLGILYSAEEALKIGLIDDIATDKDDAIAKCEKFLEKFQKINPQARAMTKQFFRGRTLAEFDEMRETDLDMFLNLIQSPKVQQSLGKYIEMLKSRK